MKLLLAQCPDATLRSTLTGVQEQPIECIRLSTDVNERL